MNYTQLKRFMAMADYYHRQVVFAQRALDALDANSGKLRAIIGSAELFEADHALHYRVVMMSAARDENLQHARTFFAEAFKI